MGKIIRTITLGLAVTAAAATASAAPVLWDIGASANANNVNATVADFIAAGVTENLGGAVVAHVDGAQFMTNGNIIVSMSAKPNAHAASGYSGAGSSIIKDYAYFSNASQITNTIRGLSSELDPDTEYSLYLWGKGDAANQYSTFTYDGTAIVISSLDPKTNDADEFFAKFTFTTGSTVEDTLQFLWDRTTTYQAFNGFAIAAVSGSELETTITPEFGATYVTNVPTIEVEVTNGSLDVDVNSFTMDLVLAGVTNDVTSSVVVDKPSASVTTFSYTPVMMLENGAEYTVLYSVAGIGGVATDYVSLFTTAPDVHYSTTPLDGATYVATDAAVSVIFTNVAISLSNLYASAEMVVNSNDVSSDVVISYPSDGVMKFEYVHGGLDFSQLYDVQLNVARTDGYTNTVAFSFTSALDPAIYLIAPGIRNGGFELVDGVAGYTGQMTVWARIDDWSDESLAGAKTEAIPAPTEGTRALVTGNGSETYNITETTISDGDIFEYKWTIPGRANGVSAGLAYMDETDGVVVVSNSLVYVIGGATPAEYGGSYLFDSIKDPNAIGKPVGIIFIDDNSGGGAVYVDEARLFYGNIAVQSFSPAADATGVADTAPVQVVIAEAASQVDTNALVLTVDGADVTTNSVISDTASGITITYTPEAAWAPGKHFIAITAGGSPEGTASQSWNFRVDPIGTYLISPEVRNGSFELVNGAADSTVQVSDWGQIDNWDSTTNGVPKTEVNILATDGSRIFVTGNGSETFNMTETSINNGDRFGYSFIVVGRSFGVTAALAYMDGEDVVVVSNSMTFVEGGTTPFSVSDAYTFSSATDPAAIGKTIGVIFIDNNAGSGAVQIDEVRLYTDDSKPTEEPVIQEFSVDGSTVTLSWTTQDLGLYSLQRKSDLVNGVWDTVLSDLPAGSTTTNVSASGANQEFYQVISQ
ncbi:Ig-like domain-containing protein [Pontiellaceae bacterium B1224]|nr:Ig-like domain-containing protein [Pontiellaceae bacterium B1224]